MLKTDYGCIVGGFDGTHSNFMTHRLVEISKMVSAHYDSRVYQNMLLKRS